MLLCEKKEKSSSKKSSMIFLERRKKSYNITHNRNSWKRQIELLIHKSPKCTTYFSNKQIIHACLKQIFLCIRDYGFSCVRAVVRKTHTIKCSSIIDVQLVNDTSSSIEGKAKQSRVSPLNLISTSIFTEISSHFLSFILLLFCGCIDIKVTKVNQLSSFNVSNYT